MGLGKTWISSSGVTCTSVGTCSPSTSVTPVSAFQTGTVAVAQSESLELLLWLFTLGRWNPALFSWRRSYVCGKCPVDKCVSPQSGCFSVLLFFPAWRWWIECQLYLVQLPDITMTAASLGLTLCSSDWAQKGIFWDTGTGTSLNCQAAARGALPVGLSSNSGIKDSLEWPGGCTDNKVYGNELRVTGKSIWK